MEVIIDQQPRENKQLQTKELLVQRGPQGRRKKRRSEEQHERVVGQSKIAGWERLEMKKLEQMYGGIVGFVLPNTDDGPFELRLDVLTEGGIVPLTFDEFR